MIHFGGRDRARLDKYFESVDGRSAVYWEGIHQLVEFQLWQCDKLTLPLSAHGELADGG